MTEEVARTTERPVETESEIMRLLRRAKELGVAPHVLDIGCDEYKVLAGGGAGGSVDYDKLLTITNQHLERAIGQGLLLPRAPGRPLVVVYGGALHNDLFPDPTLAKYTFGAPRPRRHARRVPRDRSLRPRDGRRHAGVEGRAVVRRLAARGRGQRATSSSSATRARRSWFSGAGPCSRLPRVDARRRSLSAPFSFLIGCGGGGGQGGVDGRNPRRSGWASSAPGRACPSARRAETCCSPRRRRTTQAVAGRAGDELADRRDRSGAVAGAAGGADPPARHGKQQTVSEQHLRRDVSHGDGGAAGRWRSPARTSPASIRSWGRATPASPSYGKKGPATPTRRRCSRRRRSRAWSRPRARATRSARSC